MPSSRLRRCLVFAGRGFGGAARLVLDSVTRREEHSIAVQHVGGGIRTTERVDRFDLAQKLGETLRPDADVPRDLLDIVPELWTAWRRTSTECEVGKAVWSTAEPHRQIVLAEPMQGAKLGEVPGDEERSLDRPRGCST
jgi:hypothetical protein